MRNECCKVRIVVEGNSLYMICGEAPVPIDPLNLVKGWSFTPYEWSTAEFDAAPDNIKWEIDYIDWSKVSLVSHHWIEADELIGKCR